MATEKLNTGHTITKWTCQKKLDSKWPLFRQRRQPTRSVRYGRRPNKKIIKYKVR